MERRDVRGTASRIGFNEAILRMRCFIVIFVGDGIVRLQIVRVGLARVKEIFPFKTNRRQIGASLSKLLIITSL